VDYDIDEVNKPIVLVSYVKKLDLIRYSTIFTGPLYN